MSAATGLFDSLPETNHLKLLGPGSPDLKKTTDFLSLTKQEIASATGVTPHSIRFDRQIPDELRQRLTEIAMICELVAQHFGGDVDKTTLWFRLPNPLLGNLCPRDMIRLGRYKKVFNFVMTARQGEQRAAKAASR